jgi:hypothetical protein
VSHRAWQQLPKAVRAAVEEHTGPVQQVVPVGFGSVSDLVVILHTASSDVFCKGVTASNPRAWMHRREANVNPHVHAFAPRLRWQVDQDEWFLLGFDRAPGRHINGTPGSSDLPVLAETLAAISAVTAPRTHRFQPAGARWGEWIDPNLIDGDTLVHADVNLRNFLIHNGRIAVVDWATPCRGAGWLDTALMAIRLIHAGHTPIQAAEWAQQVPAWRTAPKNAIHAFAGAAAARGAAYANQAPAPHLRQLADAASAWATFLATRDSTTRAS